MPSSHDSQRTTQKGALSGWKPHARTAHNSSSLGFLPDCQEHVEEHAGKTAVVHRIHLLMPKDSNIVPGVSLLRVSLRGSRWYVPGGYSDEKLQRSQELLRGISSQGLEALHDGGLALLHHEARPGRSAVRSTAPLPTSPLHNHSAQTCWQTAPPARAPRHGLTPKAALQTNAVLMLTYHPRGPSQSEDRGEKPSGHSKPIFRHTRSSSAAYWLLKKVEQSLEMRHWLATLHTSRGRGGALCHGTWGGLKIYNLHLNARMSENAVH